ncbi:MAG: RdgB/HAM1 family non-canonical purine NTP pyrophosphatase [Saprospiraceae bacterium]|nr:RdgB/HAM1 family non-canonical purine NTP pyrophosphatase [Candidatus Opimibacter iunctus]
MTGNRTLLFASRNSHKLEEIRKMIPPGYLLSGLNDLHWTEEIPEPFDTFEANARAKVSYVFDRTGLPCFADDSGLEVDSLDGRPGVWSARYAGEHRDNVDNLMKVLDELGNSTARSARFIAVIAYQVNAEKIMTFTGKIEGSIGLTPTGHGGFGYDPIFIPSGFDQSFGELPADLKNRISHRAMAMSRFLDFLSNH